jgi:hypothetical protein
MTDNTQKLFEAYEKLYQDGKISHQQLVTHKVIKNRHRVYRLYANKFEGLKADEFIKLSQFLKSKTQENN